MSVKINSELIITGDGESYKNGSIVIENSTIVYAGEAKHAPNADSEMHSPVLMPGMWDAHTHFFGLQIASLEGMAFINPKMAVLRSTWDVRELLRAGFTNAREVGGYGIDLNKAIQENLIQGPRIYAAGQILSTTGGHADIHNMSLDLVSALGDNHLGLLCDGVAECLKAVRTNLRKGAEVIKYCASGGVMSMIDNPHHQQFSMEEQRAIVAEAKRSEVAIAAHCHGKAGIKSALEAGVTTIDHGSFLDEELADLMLEKNAILVPTSYLSHKMSARGAEMGIPQYALDKLQDLVHGSLEAVKIAIRKNVPIATGTDIFFSGPGQIFGYGDNAKEIINLVEAGLSNMEAIVAATGNGPRTIGPRAPKSGMIKIGYEADVLMLSQSPLDKIEVLLNKSNIQVIKQGKLINF